MLAIAQPSATGMTAQADERQHRGHQRRQQEHALVGAGRDDRLLEDELEQVGEGLQQPPGADDIRAAAQLHRRPDLAVGIEQIGDEDQQHDEQQQRSAPTISARQDVDGEKPSMRLLRRLRGSRLRARRRAFRHDRRCARDRVGQIEILDRRRETLLADFAAWPASSLDLGAGAGVDLVDAGEMRMRGIEHRRANAAANRGQLLCRAHLTARARSPSPRAHRPAERAARCVICTRPSVLT